MLLLAGRRILPTMGAAVRDDCRRCACTCNRSGLTCNCKPSSGTIWKGTDSESGGGGGTGTGGGGGGTGGAMLLCKEEQVVVGGGGSRFHSELLQYTCNIFPVVLCTMYKVGTSTVQYSIVLTAVGRMLHGQDQLLHG